MNGIIYEYDLATAMSSGRGGLYEVLGYRLDEVPPTVEWWGRADAPGRQRAGRQRRPELKNKIHG